MNDERAPAGCHQGHGNGARRNQPTRMTLVRQSGVENTLGPDAGIVSQLQVAGANNGDHYARSRRVEQNGADSGLPDAHSMTPRSGYREVSGTDALCILSRQFGARRAHRS